MTLSISNHRSETKTLGLYPDQNPATKNSKTLGGAGVDPALPQWVEENRHIYDAIMNGTSDLPPADQEQFKQWWDWAMTQMNGGSQWDPMGSGESSVTDPLGGQEGTSGNTVFDDVQTVLEYTGEPGPYDVYSFDTIINISKTTVDVVLENATDTRFQPPGKVIKATLKNKATGVETVVFFQNVDDINSIKINTPNGLHITDKTGDPRIEIGKYVEGATEENSGMPEGAVIEGDTATYPDVLAGQTLEFSPPFGNTLHHICHGPTNITTKTSDQVLVNRRSDGSYLVTVTDLDGNVTDFTIPAGFPLNVNAHEDNVTFMEGGKVVEDAPNDGGPVDKIATEGNGGTGGDAAADLDIAGESPYSDGADGIPVGWKHFSLNGVQAPEEEEEPAVDTSDWPPQLLDLFDAIGIEEEDYANLNVPDTLISEIQAGLTPPSEELIQALLNADNTLKQAWDRVQNNPEDDHSWTQLKNRLSTLLSILFSGVTKTGEYPEDLEVDALLESKTIFFDGLAFEITDSFGFKRIDETTETGESGEVDEPGAEGKAEDALANAQRLADMPGVQWTAEEILEWADQQEPKIDLSYIGYPPPDDIWKLLYEIDNEFQNTMQNWINNPSYETMKPLRNHVIDMLKVLYPDKEISDNGSGDMRRNDVKVDGVGVNIFPDKWIDHEPSIYGVSYSEDELWQYIAKHWGSNDPHGD